MSDNSNQSTATKIDIEVVENKTNSNDSNSSNNPNKEINFENLTKFLDLYLVQKAPSLPKNIKDFVFKWLPLFNKISIGLCCFISLFVILSIFFSPISGILTLISLIITVFYSIQAINGLSKNEYSGWENIYKSVLISSVIKILAGDFVFSVLFTAISLYVLFQVRSYYKRIVITKI